MILEERLSPERLGPYRQACGGDWDRALALYEWNVDVSTAFWSTLSQVEVILRNALHKELTEWSAREHAEPNWYLDPSGLLTEQAHDDITARLRATRNGRTELPGGVVAELSFGFWRSPRPGRGGSALGGLPPGSDPLVQTRAGLPIPQCVLHEWGRIPDPLAR